MVAFLPASVSACVHTVQMSKIKANQLHICNGHFKWKLRVAVYRHKMHAKRTHVFMERVLIIFSSDGRNNSLQSMHAKPNENRVGSMRSVIGRRLLICS